MEDSTRREELAVGMSGTEGGRRPTGVPDIPTADAGRGTAVRQDQPSGDPRPPHPEVLEKPTRRRFTADYKLGVLREADACQASGQLGSLLRREGLYSSHLVTWRKQRDGGALEALKPRRRGRKTRIVNPLVAENLRLARENGRLATRLRHAEIIIDVQKKVSEILGVTLPPLPTEGSSS
jgi:transposase